MSEPNSVPHRDNAESEVDPEAAGPSEGRASQTLESSDGNELHTRFATSGLSKVQITELSSLGEATAQHVLSSFAASCKDDKCDICPSFGYFKSPDPHHSGDSTGWLHDDARVATSKGKASTVFHHRKFKTNHVPKDMWAMCKSESIEQILQYGFDKHIDSEAQTARAASSQEPEA